MQPFNGGTIVTQKINKAPKSGQATFRFYAPNAREVKLAGDFNQWQPQSLRKTREENGFWENTLDLKRGQYQYKFIVDGEWQIDSQHPNCVQNPYGTLNSVIRVD